MSNKFENIVTKNDLSTLTFLLQYDLVQDISKMCKILRYFKYSEREIK